MPPKDVERALAIAEPVQVGPALVALREDQWFERKSRSTQPLSLGNVIAGMANADGGTIIVGVWNGVVEGTDADPRRRNDLMQAHIDFCVPPVRAHHRLLSCVNSEGLLDHVLVVEVEPSDQVHANNRDEVYLRVGDETRKLSFQQRQELLFDKGQASYETRPVSGTSLGDVEEVLAQGYADAVGAHDLNRLFLARGLATASGELTIAGCLLFGEAPQQYFPEAFVRVLRYRGTERGVGARQQLISDERFEGPIPRQLQRAREAVKSLVPTRRALLPAGVFGDVPLVPEDAWLEGLVNAVVHRSYSLAGDHVRVEVFDDRIEVSSPGRFPGIVDIENPLGAARFARNPRIARVCADLRFGQELGEGIRRIYEEMRAAGLVDPQYRQTAASVQLTLSTDAADRALEARLPPGSREVMGVLREADRLSTGEVAERLGYTRPTALRRLNALREVGLVDWVGKSQKDPRAYWALASPRRPDDR